MSWTPDTRPDWTSWARDRLALAKLPESGEETVEELPEPLLPVPQESDENVNRLRD